MGQTDFLAKQGALDEQQYQTIVHALQANDGLDLF